jgi:glycosyltransferase involved in cell wall biosynthesis
LEALSLSLLDMTRIAAVIPAYQEARHIAEVARRTRAQLEQVLVVDDGSNDETAEQARAGGAEVILHPRNCGKGETIRTGLRHWFDAGMDYIVLLDADGQHRPEEIPRFIQAANGNPDIRIFLGSRMSDTASMPFIRRIVNRYMSGKVSRACGQRIPDTQCGFRMLHRDLIPDLLGGADRFDYETEMLLVASRKGYRIVAVPITTVYSDEISSINPVRDTLRFFALMRRYGRATSYPG